jgi:hypothetical protein
MLKYMIELHCDIIQQHYMLASAYGYSLNVGGNLCHFPATGRGNQWRQEGKRAALTCGNRHCVLSRFLLLLLCSLVWSHVCSGNETGRR